MPVFKADKTCLCGLDVLIKLFGHDPNLIIFTSVLIKYVSDVITAVAT